MARASSLVVRSSPVRARGSDGCRDDDRVHVLENRLPCAPGGDQLTSAVNVGRSSPACVEETYSAPIGGAQPHRGGGRRSPVPEDPPRSRPSTPGRAAVQLDHSGRRRVPSERPSERHQFHYDESYYPLSEGGGVVLCHVRGKGGWLGGRKAGAHVRGKGGVCSRRGRALIARNAHTEHPELKRQVAYKPDQRGDDSNTPASPSCARPGPLAFVIKVAAVDQGPHTTDRRPARPGSRGAVFLPAPGPRRVTPRSARTRAGGFSAPCCLERIDQ